MSDVETAPTGADAATVPETPAQPEQAQETTQESATATPDEQQEEQARDEKGRFQKRVNELTRKTYDARREAEQARRERDQLYAELERLRQPAAPDPNVDPIGHVQHLAREEARRLVGQERANWQQQQEQQRFQTLAQDYATREQDFADKNPGYQEAVDAFTAVAGPNPYLAEVLMTAEYGPEVVHYLGTHLDEAARIAHLPPHLAAREVTRIESRFTPKSKPVSSAPNPPPTLGGGKATVAKKEDDMTVEEWLVHRRAQLNKK
jgi:hypothetical protein